MASPSSIICLDVGERRIGVASSPKDVRLASPYTTIENNESTLESVNDIATELNADRIIIGLPRNMSGEPTAQTKYVEDFVARLKDVVAIPVFLQDESLTSVKAEAELQSRKKPFSKGDIDALAATYILQDYLETFAGVKDETR